MPVAVLLNVTRDTKVQVRLRASVPALQRRLPHPWIVASSAQGTHMGANLFAVFSEVLLRQDAGGGPAPAAVDLSVTFLIPTVHAETQDSATFILSALTANPDAAPGRYRVAALATAWRARTMAGEGQHTTVTDEILLRAIDGGVGLQLEYDAGVPVRTQWSTIVRSVADPGLARAYRSDALVDVVHSEPAGIARARDVRLNVADPRLRDLFDGTQQLVSIAVVPWFRREEFTLD